MLFYGAEVPYYQTDIVFLCLPFVVMAPLIEYDPKKFINTNDAFFKNKN